MPSPTLLWDLVSVGSVQFATPIDLPPFKVGDELAKAEFSQSLHRTLLSLCLSSELPLPLRQCDLEARPLLDLLKFTGGWKA